MDLTPELQRKVYACGNTCRRVRKASGIRLYQLETIAPYTKATLSMFERGKNRNVAVLLFYFSVFPELFRELEEELKNDC